MKRIKGYARGHRKKRTPAETALYRYLLKVGIRFRTQRPFDFFIVDFLIPERWLIIELDGSFHDGREAYDARRTAYLEAKGFTVLRFKNEVALRNPAVIRDAIFATPERPAPDDWRKLYGVAKY